MEVKQFELFAPPLKELATVLEKGLAKYYGTVSVTVKSCPNLSEAPYSLTSEGLSGNESLFDIGGVKNLMPKPIFDKTFAISKAVEAAKFKRPCFTVGAGAGPFYLTGKNCELVADCTFCNEKNITKNRVIILDDKDEKSRVAIQENDEFSLLLNLYASNGNSGEVLEIVCEQRLTDVMTDDHNFANRIRDVLLAHYGKEKPVGLGGLFVYERGTASIHIMPGFSQSPLNCGAEVDAWLKFFKIDAPLVVLGELISADPGYDLRLEHFHCFKPGSATDGGHFHIDTTPQTAKYRAFFNVAKRVYRVAQP